MARMFRAAGLAAVAFCTLASLVGSSPSKALPTAITSSNVASAAPVPTLAVDSQSLSGSDTALSGPATDKPAPVPAVENETAHSLSELVSEQATPDTLDREAECLAGAVYFEAKSEPLEGQLAVADVVINRAKSGGRFPPSICAVVYQPGQFSFVRHGQFPHINRDGAAWKRAVAIAEIAMKDMWDGKVSNALYFHAASVSPGWHRERIARLGNHVFYR